MENLSKEKADLNEKLRAQEEGAVLSLTFMSASCVIIILFKLTLLSLTEYAAQAEEFANTVKSHEKTLNTERTLKTQVHLYLY